MKFPNISFVPLWWTSYRISHLMFHFPKSKKLFESRESVGERGFFGFHLRMPRCYFFNLVETPMFVTTGYLSETFCENPKCGHREKNDNDQAWEKQEWTSSEAISLGGHFQHLRPRSGSQADLRSTSVPFINKIWKIQIAKIWILIAQKESVLCY